MIRKIAMTFAALLCAASMLAQTGGIKGTVVNRLTKAPVEGAGVAVKGGLSVKTGSDGTFEITGMADGNYAVAVEADDFMPLEVNVAINGGYMRNLFTLSLTPAQNAEYSEDAANFAEFDMDDSGYSDNPTVLFGSNDIYSNITSFGYSSIRFKTRGYASESQDVYLSGIRMNDAITGYSPFSLWSGLNEATRSKDTVIGNEVSSYGLGGYNGLTNIMANASSVRTGWRGSVLTNSALYRLRLMASYASGELDNGWSYAFNVSARLGGNDWIQGVFYRSFGYYAAVEKRFNPAHRLGFTFMAAPGERGAQNASTQEVYDLTGDNMYNSNWGYHNGKVRNARVRKTHEPIAILKHEFTPNNKFEGSATLLYRFGKNGYTALDWYDAPDPRPDYYRNLPSYFFDENPDLKRNNYPKYLWSREAWMTDYASTTHINWDRLASINVMNKTSLGARSKYVQQERRVDQRDLNLALTGKWKPAAWVTLNGGLNGKINRTENFQTLDDLLGGDYYLDIDSFAERDFASSQAKVQNDLDYFLQHGKARQLAQGDKYGYDYYAQIRKVEGWLNSAFKAGNFSANLGGRLGYQSVWRDGLVRKGLFAGLDANGREILDPVTGESLTSYDHDGNVITSYGKSDTKEFLTYAAKASAEYLIGGKMRFYGNVGYYADAPTFTQSFISPRTRNTMVDDLTTIKTFSADLNYQLSYNGYDVRLTGYYTTISDQTDVMSFYDDLQNSFTNFAMSGIDERHVGMELGFKLPTPVSNLSLKGAFSYGKNVYTSDPFMTQTVDNSSELVIEHQRIPYWKSNPVFAKDSEGKYTDKLTGYQEHYVPSTPQLAATLGLSWNYNYWFVDVDANYFAKSYLDMNPLYRTDMATAGPDKTVTPDEIMYMTTQEEFDPAFIMNASVGKSWYIQRKYQLGFSLQVNNLTNNRGVKTGGYEQTRLVDNTESKERYYRFDPKYFYMSGLNYMLNIYFRF